MSYQRDNIYRAKCEKTLQADCQRLGPISDSIEMCFINACQDGWKMFGNRQSICPQCLHYIQSKGVKMLNA